MSINMNFSEKAAYYENISHSQKQAADYLIKLLDFISKEHHVLDIGCGTGYLTELIYDKTSFIEGMDISNKMIEIAKSKRPFINFFVGNGESIIYKNKYDIILTSAVTYYFKNLVGTFKRFHEAIKNNGYYILQAQTIVTPQFTTALNGLLNDSYTASFYKSFKMPTHQLHLEEYIDILHQSGFEIKHQELVNFNTQYTTQQAIEIFKSGTATPLLNESAYQRTLTTKYKKKFWKIVEDGLKKQSHEGIISLDVPRAFIIACKQ